MAPELWPQKAEHWYRLYEEHFWQHRWTAVGFREFPHGMKGKNWYADVDAGPVLAGHGISASAFGVGAAAVNGRFDQITLSDVREVADRFGLLAELPQTVHGIKQAIERWPSFAKRAGVDRAEMETIAKHLSDRVTTFGG